MVVYVEPPRTDIAGISDRRPTRSGCRTRTGARLDSCPRAQRVYACALTALIDRMITAEPGTVTLGLARSSPHVRPGLPTAVHLRLFVAWPRLRLVRRN